MEIYFNIGGHGILDINLSKYKTTSEINKYISEELYECMRNCGFTEIKIKGYLHEVEQEFVQEKLKNNSYNLGLLI